ncbi:MAG: 50S ribosomal protein L30e [Candidatus Methanomethylicia archaeon]|nr:50S ribosomal protein L30e [Candidatus Methanomethylicia archaeon]MCX8169281.1 50S ribosomal protein L30e [Candidatus Methanomethylicia archaeon]MDW7988936.1 50S ribosomal protein L30e [Nitrososphaerota archaeon]
MSLKLDKELQVILKTGKMIFGSKSAIKSVKLGKAKMIIISSTIPKNIKEDILYYAKLSNIPVIEFNGSSWDLGFICGKPFMISAITVLDPGESEILKLAEGR